jgi:hypothetical protein
MSPIYQLENSTHFPLCLRKGRCAAAGYPPAYPLRVQRGTEGDLFICAVFKSPLAPLLQRGEQVSRDAQISLKWFPA